ncbi:MAG: hypothetical protein V2I43_21285, partial [Parvularcula sp.]|nr:hypothetical protein [Parvularcula sp.]
MAAAFGTKRASKKGQGPMRLAELLESGTRDEGKWHFSIPEDWAQGRTAYGGLTAALSAHA